MFARQESEKHRRLETDKLNALPGDMFFAANPFENSDGHFWGITETRPYMQARFALVESLLAINTTEAVQEGHSNVMDMLRLCRSDDIGVRDLVPALFLRLKRDQECYDYVKWYNTSGQDSHYDWVSSNFLKASN